MSTKLMKIDQLKKPYLYKKIVNYVKKNLNKIKLLKFNDSSRKQIKNDIIRITKEYSNINGIDFEDCDINNFGKMYSNMSRIIYSLKNINSNNYRKTHLKIIQNLLFFKKNEEIISSFDSNNDNSNENNFTANDFILTYVNNVIEIIFNNDFNKDNSIELNNIYLYLIFQINDPEVIIILKIIVYRNLYSKRNYDNFILDTSKNIFNKEEFNNNNLKNLAKNNNELIDIDIKDVSEEVKTVFKDKKTTYDNLFEFFVRNHVINNCNFIKEKISSDNILIDNLNYDKNKLHLFSPEFLIANGLKSEIKNSDIEIFNEDNYTVEIFAKYIIEIIDIINDSIKNNNFSNNFFKENLIQFYEMDYLHYISAKLNYEHIFALNGKKKNIIVKNDFIQIKTENKRRKIAKNEIKFNYDDKKNNSYNSEEKSNLSQSLSLSTKKLFLEFQKETSDILEYIIYQRLIDNIQKDNNLIKLPNILFFLNLNIPVLNEETNLIEFKPVHIDFFNGDKKFDNNNYYYGCKEIDSIFQNNSNQSYEVSDSSLFRTNLTYVKQKDGQYFNFSNNNEFKIIPKSVLFCEIKKYFPNQEKGNEEVINIKYDKSIIKKHYNYETINEKDPLYPYYTQLKKVIKKFRYFFNTFKNKLNEEKELNIHIIFMYDSFDVYKEEITMESIKTLTERTLNNYYWRFKNMGNVCFQLVFFDKVKLDKKNLNLTNEHKAQLEEKDKIIKEKEEERNKIEEEKNKIEEEKNKIEEEKNKIIKEKEEENNKKIQEKNEEIEKVTQQNIIMMKLLGVDSNLSEEEINKKISELLQGKKNQ